MGNKALKTTTASSKPNGKGKSGQQMVKTKTTVKGPNTVKKRLSFLWLGNKYMSKPKGTTTFAQKGIADPTADARDPPVMDTTPPVEPTSVVTIVVPLKQSDDSANREVTAVDEEMEHPVFSRTSSKRNKLVFTASGRLKNAEEGEEEKEDENEGGTKGGEEKQDEKGVGSELKTEEPGAMIDPEELAKLSDMAAKYMADNGISKDVPIEERTRTICAALIHLHRSETKDDDALLQACGGLRRVLSIVNKPPIQTVVDSGVVPDLIQILQTHENRKILFETCWAVTNIASGSSTHTNTLVASGVLDALYRFLTEIDDDDCVEQAVWCLGNIAGDHYTLRDQCLNRFPSEILTRVFENRSAKISMQRNCIWMISNLCRGKPMPNLNLIMPYLPLVAKVVKSHSSGTDDEVLTDALWTLSYASDGPNERIQRVIDTGCVQHLLEILLSTTVQKTALSPALRTIGNILTGDESQTNVVLELNGLDVLYQMMKTSLAKGDNKNLKELCWAASNIAAGTAPQIQQLIHHDGMLDVLREIIDYSLPGSVSQPAVKVDTATLKEAVFVLANMFEGCSAQQAQLLVSGDSKYAVLPHLICVLRESHVSAVAKNGIVLCYVKLGVEQCIRSCYMSKVSSALLSHGSTLVGLVCNYMQYGLTQPEMDMDFESTTLTCLLAMGFPCLDTKLPPTLVDSTKPYCSAFVFENRVCYISNMILFASFSILPRLKTRGSHSWIGRQIPIELWVELKKFLFVPVNQQPAPLVAPVAVDGAVQMDFGFVFDGPVFQFNDGAAVNDEGSQEDEEEEDEEGAETDEENSQELE